MIAACLIVRNSGEMIETCLESIRPFVDEINVLDTGSTDDTRKRLAKLGRLTYRKIDLADGSHVDRGGKMPEAEHATWTGARDDKYAYVPLAPIRVTIAKDVPEIDGSLSDFSWARERSFELASPEHEWLLWLDDDDIIIGAEHLRAIAHGAHPYVDAFAMYYDYARDEKGNVMCELWRERMIRRDRGFVWMNPVHEVFLPPGRPPSLVKVEPHLIRYFHTRPADRYPPERNLRILRHAAEQSAERGEERPEPRVTIYLGTELMAHGQWVEAEQWLKTYLTDERTAVGDERSQAAHKLALCMRMQQRPLEAIDVEFEALKERDDWGENAVGLCESFMEVGDWPRCEHWARRALELGKPESILILNPLEFNFVPRYRLAMALSNQGKWDEAMENLQIAASILPEHPLVQETMQGFGQARLEDEVTRAALLLREVAIRFDENLKAFNIMENVPYIIAEKAEIVSARAMTKENVLHALRPDEYRRWYEDEPKESTVPDEWVPIAGEHIERVKYVLELCQRFEAEEGRKPRVLDLGCNDFWQAGYLWLNGEYVCDGIELNKGSVEKAAGRIERFGMPGRIVQGDIHDAVDLMGNAPGYDIVTCFEVYEHVPEPDRLLEVMEEMCADDGYVCLTTPNGAFEQGNLQFWQLVERKGHLRAVLIHDVARKLNPRGEIVDLRLHQGNRLVYACYQPGPKKGKVIIWGGGAWEPWSPRSIREGGIGGSETMLAILAVRLGQAGYDVTCYCGAEPGFYGGSLWRPVEAFDPTEEADAIIVSRNPGLFDVELHAPVRALWCHDHTYPITEAQAERMTHVVTLSEWQKQRFVRQHPAIDGKVVVIGNGILLSDEERFPSKECQRSFSRRKPRAIYSSSADRGLDVLLECWPKIRARVPDAELHVFYGWDTFDAIAARGMPGLRELKTHILELFEAAGGEDGGVFMRGRLGQLDLYEEMRKARVWAYPTAFLETSCITAMEAQANGLAIVSSDLGALSETVDAHGVLIPWNADEDMPHNRSEDYRKAFIENVSALLSDAHVWRAAHKLAREDIERHDFDKRLLEWEHLVGAAVLAGR